MRHRNEGRKLSRNTPHRRALLRNLVTSFLDHGRLMTTLPKAKELRPLAEKMITLGKRDSLHARRQVHAFLLKDAVARKVFDTLGPRFADRNGGYSRIVRLGHRQGDGADLAIIELIGTDLESRKAEREKAKEKKGGKAGDGKEKGKDKEDDKD